MITSPAILQSDDDEKTHRATGAFFIFMHIPNDSVNTPFRMERGIFMRQKPYRLLIAAAILFLCMSGVMVRLFSVSAGGKTAAAGIRQGTYHLHVPVSGGMIYDRNFVPLNQSQQRILAVVNPVPETVASVWIKLRNRSDVTEQLQKHVPFVCELTEPAESSANLIVLNGMEKAPGAVPAQHLIGYRQNGSGIAGLEKAYAPWLETCSAEADIVFSVNARGEVLAGGESSAVMTGNGTGGIVTTLHAEMQRITESALAGIAPNAGAAIVLDVQTGEIMACASTPVYNPDDLASALNRSDAPFVNRALSAYSVGSVFKLVTAAAALESGFSTQYMYDCTGDIEFYGQRFRCHDLSGHGLLNMQKALVKSCNPYFISLSRLLAPDMLHDTAEAFGFGTENILAPGLAGAAGYLPSEDELRVEAEKANFSFGQGKLLATPLQIAAMTACIANDGIYTEPSLIRGLTDDGQTLLPGQKPEQHSTVGKETSGKLRRMMAAVLADQQTANARPAGIRAAGKTSTAQTGRFDPDGKEYCHAWMTGFFPLARPEYAVTVFVEDGGSGNQAAAPVFREIIEQIADL